jgi:hypothetical protein
MTNLRVDLVVEIRVDLEVEEVDLEEVRVHTKIITQKTIGFPFYHTWLKAM